MHTFAVIAVDCLKMLVIIATIWLAIFSVFSMPDRLLGFRRVEGLIFVPVATIAIWLALAYLRVPMPGVVYINSFKLLAATALICGFVWCFIEDEWFGRG
jgi:hypothetical protein